MHEALPMILITGIASVFLITAVLAITLTVLNRMNKVGKKQASIECTAYPINGCTHPQFCKDGCKGQPYASPIRDSETDE